MPKTDRPPAANRQVHLPHRRERGPRVWRLSLQEPQTGRRHDFDDLDSLIAYLQKRIDALSETGKEPELAYPPEVESKIHIARLRRFMARFGQAQNARSARFRSAVRTRHTA